MRALSTFARCVVATTLATAGVAGGTAAAQEASIRFLGTDPVVLGPGRHVAAAILVPAATGEEPVEVRVLAATPPGGGAASDLRTSCVGGTGRGSASSPLVCSAQTPVLVLTLQAAEDAEPVTAMLVAVAAGAGTATTTVTVEGPADPAGPVPTAPARVEFTAESFSGPAEASRELDEAFTVVGSPLRAIATGASDEAVVSLATTDDGPEVSVTGLDAYGDVAATLDVNGPADGGVMEVLIHHRRPVAAAVGALVAGALVASLLTAVQRRRQRRGLQERYAADRADGRQAQQSFLDQVEPVSGLDGPTLTRAWALDRVVRPLDDAEQATASTVAAHGNDIRRYVECCRAGSGLAEPYDYFRGSEADGSSPVITMAIAQELHQGPGDDVAKGASRLKSADRAAKEAERLDGVLRGLAQGNVEPYTSARRAVRQAPNLADRAALDRGWQAANQPPDRVEEMHDGPRDIIARATAGAGAYLGFISAPAVPPAAARGGAATAAVARVLGSKPAWVAALLAGFLIAMMLDLGQTFGSDASWGTGWDMIAAFGRAFAVTGSLQLARNLGASAAPA